jgi:hypothetical protein
VYFDSSRDNREYTQTKLVDLPTNINHRSISRHSNLSMATRAS